MKTRISIALCLSLALTHTAQAEIHHFIDYAKVKEVNPVYATIERQIPQKSCWTERSRRESRQHNSATSTIMGGIIGGAIGHSVGRGGDNKKIGAAVGTLLGASIGKDVGHNSRNQRRHPEYQNVERCETHYRAVREEQLVGYDVTYQYRGEFYQTRTEEDPGKRMKVKISLSPVIEF
ncbi:MAG: glycine zipper 2TM domain-containing protein [Agarilytica sp.]